MKTNGRLLHHPILGSLPERKIIPFCFNSQPYTAFEDETIAAALLANGILTLRMQEETGTPRGIYCNIGHCFECRVTVDGVQGMRACLTPVTAEMDVRSGGTLPRPFKRGGTQ